MLDALAQGGRRGISSAVRFSVWLELASLRRGDWRVPLARACGPWATPWSIGVASADIDGTLRSCFRRGELCAGESSVPVVFACCMLTGCSRMRGLCRWRHVSACSTRPRCSCVSCYSVRSVFAHLFLVRAFVTATWSELTCFAQAVKPWSQTRCLWRCLLGCWLCAMASLSLVALVLSFQAIRLCVPLLVRLTAEVGSKRSCALRGMQGRGRGLGLVAGGLSAYRPWGRASYQLAATIKVPM